MCKVFIGSSKESILLAQQIQLSLSNQDMDCRVWDQDVFLASNYPIPQLVETISDNQYAIFIYADDDDTSKKGDQQKTARDNVIFETGLAIALLGMKNCFIFKEKSVILPSDFEGLTVIEYKISNKQLIKTQRNMLQKEIGPAVTKFLNSLEKNPQSSNIESWGSYCIGVENICKLLSRSPRQGGFKYDAIVGIARGGIIAADMINRKHAATIPLFSLLPDMLSEQPRAIFDSEVVSFNQCIFESLNAYKNILLVDDITRTGNTIFDAEKTLKQKCPNSVVKTAIIYIPESLKEKVDFYGITITDSTLAMPYSIFD